VYERRDSERIRFARIATTILWKEEIFDRLRPNDVEKPAHFYLQRVINEHLAGRVSPGLLWDPHGIDLHLRVIPHNLIGALWLQLATAVEADSHYRQCPGCERWFRVAPGTKRSDSIVCSPTCRTRMYRSRLWHRRQRH
jgi:hypothetical protein